MHCLNLKITYNCTNDCSFCFSSYLKNNVIDLDGLKQAVIQGANNGCTELVISGGEPTLLPDTIIELISVAEQYGYEKYIIQTNGSGIPDNRKLVDYLDMISARKELCISFSIHGHTADIHDTMSRTPGAFDKLLSAIRIISDSNAKIYTNTVISSLNIGHLADIVSLLLPFRPEIIQFSMMHLETPNELSTGLIESAHAVRELKNIISHDILKTEGIPYCLMYGLETCVGESYWPTSLDLYNKNDDYMADFSQLEHGMRWKGENCSKCIMDEICAGVWKEHSSEFTANNIIPIN